MARFYANMDISKPMKIRISLRNKKGDHFQEILFDIPPIICAGCNHYRYIEKAFPAKNKQQN